MTWYERKPGPVYPDKLLIWNPGELPPSWTVRNLLRKHASVPFNPAIARTFFRAGMIEVWGQGIERIRDAAREAGTPEPELNAEPAGLWVEFRYLPEHVAATGEAAEMTPVEAQTPVETPVEISGEGWTPGETPAAIMALLRENPRLTLAEVAEKLGRSLKTIKREAARLVSSGNMRFIGPRKSGSWEVAPITGEMTPEALATTLEVTLETAGMTPETRVTTLEMTPEIAVMTPETRVTILEMAPEIAGMAPEARATTLEMILEEGGTTLETPPLPVQKRILQLITANPRVTQPEMAAAIGLTEKGIRYHLDKMRKNGRVRHVGPRKGGHWEALE